MLVVETVARIRREFFVKGKSIKEIVRDLGVSRNTVRKVLRSGETAFAYERSVQPLPKLGPWSSELDGLLEANERKARRERLTMIRVFEELQGLGYRGGYDAVRRYAASWHRERSAVTAAAYVPLSFAPGEAYQFDWSHEVVIIAGVTTTVKVAHMRLCHSRMFYVRAYRLENTNPCRVVRLNKRRQCERFLTVPELTLLGTILAAERAGTDKVRSIAATAITLLLLTGCRSSEVMSLQWGDMLGNRLKLRDSKTGPRTVWLGDEARALIDTIPRFRNNPWMFWNTRHRCPMQTANYYWYEFREKAGLPGVRIHDLRHTFASHAAMNKETLPMIGRLLGHANHQSTARYAHLDDNHVLDAAQQIGDAIERMMS